VWSITPVLATVIMLLVVTRDGYSREGWKSLCLHRLGLRVWWIAFFGTLLITVAATAAVWATPLASVTMPPGGVLNSVVRLVIQTLLLATTFSLAEEIGIRGYLLPKLLPLGRKRALLLTGLVWATWHMPLIYLTALLPIGKPVIGVPLFYAAVVAGSFFYGYLRLASGSLWPSSIAHATHNSAWGDHGRLHRHIFTLASQRLSPRRLRHRDHGRCSHRSRTGQPACPARWGGSPSGQRQARARPDRTSDYHFHLSPLRSCASGHSGSSVPSGTSAEPVITRGIGHSVRSQGFTIGGSG
jgi:membrane protease YdiL (CAAX protease family)